MPIEPEVIVDGDGVVHVWQPWLVTVAGRQTGVRVEVLIAPLDGYDDDLRAALTAKRQLDPFALGETQQAFDQALFRVGEKARSEFVREHLMPRVSA